MHKTDKIIQQLLKTRPQIHPRHDGQARCIGLSSDALEYLYCESSPEHTTLETGCGLSTLIFAQAGCRHYAVAPNRSHIFETQKSAQAFDIDLSRTEFIQGRSEYVLPNLEKPECIDTVLIDGGHAFPIPYIDWFYSARKLVFGGLLVLDDIHLKTVNILYNFLSKQPEWEVDCTFRRTAFFRKIGELDINSEWDYWNKQPFNTDLVARFRAIIRYLK